MLSILYSRESETCVMSVRAWIQSCVCADNVCARSWVCVRRRLDRRRAYASIASLCVNTAVCPSETMYIYTLYFWWRTNMQEILKPCACKFVRKIDRLSVENKFIRTLCANRCTQGPLNCVCVREQACVGSRLKAKKLLYVRMCVCHGDYKQTRTHVYLMHI